MLKSLSQQLEHHTFLGMSGWTRTPIVRRSVSESVTSLKSFSELLKGRNF